MRRIVCPLFLTLVVVSAVFAQHRERPVLALSCTADKVNLAPSDSVNLTVSLENRGSSEFYIYRTLEWG
jgi:hypothetical protein